MCDFFCYFNLKRNYDVLKSKGPSILMNKNINFNKNEAKSKMGNSTQSFTETIILLQLIQESQIKCKTVMSWISRKKKGQFLSRLFCPKEMFLTFAFYLNVQGIEHTFRICILLHIKKHYFITWDTFCSLFLKSRSSHWRCFVKRRVL